MKLNILGVIESYLECITKDEFHRYKSWDNCYNTFCIEKKTDVHILELAFYLASWGMYRGCVTLPKNSTVYN